MKSSPSLAVRTLFFTAIALIAFAANSVLCRLALGDGLIDASGFTIIRLLSGSIVLLIILQFSSVKNSVSSKGSWSASALLFIYAAAFSFAYVSLDTATGALVLFGAVQLTMILLSMMAGNRLHPSEWIGASIAFIGFVFLILPDITTPSVTGFMLMLIAGIAWGIYSIKGRASLNPLMDTAYNFFRSMPLIIILAVVTLQEIQLSTEGILLAVLSGGIASGIGYTIWYLALAGLSSTQAAVVQLLVPIIAAIGGVIFVFEPITSRLLMSGIMILGGIFIVVIGNYYFARHATQSSE